MSQASDSNSGTDRSIILLERLSTNREMTKALLESLGFKVLVAKNIDGVFAFVRDQLSDTLILDIDLLPELSAEYHSRIKSSLFRVIGISLSETPARLTSSLIDTVLYRPVSVNHFSAALNSDKHLAIYLNETYIVSEMEIVGCDVVEDMLDIFSVQQDLIIMDLETSLTSKDYSAIEHNAHKLAGLCGTLGLDNARNQLSRVEELARKQDPDVLMYSIVGLQNLLAHSLSLIQQLISLNRREKSISSEITHKTDEP